MSTLPSAEAVRLAPGRSTDLPAVMTIMTTAFEPQYGEGWTRSQCAGILPMSGVSLMLAHENGHLPPIGFSLYRTVLKAAGRAPIAPIRKLRKPFTTRHTAANHCRSFVNSGESGASVCSDVME